MSGMRQLLLAVVVVFATTPVIAAEPSVLAPFRYQSVPERLSPIEQQRALSYRSQVQGQLDRLEQRRIQAPLSARDANRLLETRGELQRLNQLTAPSP